MHQETLSRARINTLGTMCTALLVEFTLAVQLLLRQLTGAEFRLTSLMIAFVLVCHLHTPLETWIWGENAV